MRLELQKRKYIERERVTKLNWVGPHTHEINYQGKNWCIRCGDFEKANYAGTNHLIDLCAQVS